ncbi:MAG: hypothetical protein AUG45_10160 [Ktedonobacter sp. 13_1_20CM_3_54_15]|nr:MAG: hypothetical protein AUG45_10160 [Ktedonobacter sp. 13_1_20CM_3_54_15]
MIVKDTAQDGWPLVSGYAGGNVFGPWSPLVPNDRRELSLLIFCEQSLELLRELARGGQEEGKNW